MRQKAKEKLHKELTGEKHHPNKKPKTTHPGYDDCGENFSSIDDVIGNSEAFTIFDHLRTTEEHSELDVEIDQRTELFLFTVEANITPHLHFCGSEIPGTILQQAQEMPSISEAYASEMMGIS